EDLEKQTTSSRIGSNLTCPPYNFSVVASHLRWRAIALLLLLLPALLSAAPSARARRSRKAASSATSDAALAKLSLEDATAGVADRAPARGKGLSVQIAELDTGKVVLERNPQQPETIASVTKMFSTAAALHFLGPDYKFKTTFWRRGEVKEGLLQ